ncbi:Vta1 like-domain-containing protein [Gymnopilus junonius]|uniref:Vta1 like-domain-containing protein n=1 Tax=Gymnopilus junonius TaxID=109634 RepID=A0A9P5TTF9_GYMJU|nr:Vta1 like-domain-containing protein [Gymnopilus junonius]
MASSVLGLPPVPPELKPIAPYLQRAEELKNQDPVISYWCAYYAAQLGLTLKARNTPDRDFLFALLGVLEGMKADIGANDAIDIESVSSAYIENFALRVFANADNDDRSGRATRSTAKKFLAAANFLEVLNVFLKSNFSEANEEKVRYAKWKAADIAKAFREGRKPVPGPPGWAEEQEELKRLQETSEDLHIPSPPQSNPSPGFHSSYTSSSPTRHSPISSSPPKIVDIDRRLSDDPPETWSTAATPGTDSETSNVYAVGAATPNTGAYDWNETRKKKPRSGSGSSSNTIGSSRGKGDPTKGAWTDEELASATNITSSSPTKSSFKSASPDSDKKVRFSPSTTGSPPPPPTLPPPQSGSPPKEYLGPSSIYALPQLPVVPPTGVIPTLPVSTCPSTISPPFPSSASPPRNIYLPNTPIHSSPTHPIPRNNPGLPPVQPAPIDLTPGLVGKVQKHCRFAISALDYEDAEQARKELRAALRLLEG